MDKNVIDLKNFKKNKINKATLDKNNKPLTLTGLVRSETFGNIDLTVGKLEVIQLLVRQWYGCNFAFIGLLKEADKETLDIYVMPCNISVGERVEQLGIYSFYKNKYLKSEQLAGGVLTGQVLETYLPQRLEINGKIKVVRRFPKDIPLVTI